MISSYSGEAFNPPRIRRFGDHAFSLIEILVVVAIIAILAAIGVPAYQSFIAKGKSAQCVSNLRQLAIVVQDYIHDYGHYPAHGTTDADGKRVSPLGFYSYAGIRQDASCLVCPAAEYHGVNAGQNGWTRWQAAYGLNPAISPYDGRTHPPPRPASVIRPSEVILLADSSQQGTPPTFVRALSFSFNWWGGQRSYKGDPSQAETPISANTEVPGSNLTSHGFPGPLLPMRHGGRANVLFCDGHVTSITNVTQIKQKNLYWNY